MNVNASRVRTTSRSKMMIINAITTSSPKTSIKLQGPPPSFDYRKQLIPQSIQIIEQRYPQLIDLAHQGNVVAIARPVNYKERRTDGYQEPRLIILIGTAHISQSSADDVWRVINEVKPQNVVVELCKSRYGQLYSDDYYPSSSSSSDDNGTDSDTNNSIDKNSSTNNKNSNNNKKSVNPLSLSGNNFIQAYQRSVALGGQTALIIRLILSKLSEQLAKDVDVQPGIEFRSARCAAQRVGAQIVLGDRPIEVTLQRAWEALTWQLRWQLVQDIINDILQHNRSSRNNSTTTTTTDINNNTSTNKINTTTYKQQDIVDMIESIKNDDSAIDALLTSFAHKYPQLLSPLLHERDLYLAWSLKRSKAVNGTDTVVGVIGKGHMRGVLYALTHDDGRLRFRDLAGSRKGRKESLFDVKRLIVETVVVSGIVWLVNEFMTKQ